MRKTLIISTAIFMVASFIFGNILIADASSPTLSISAIGTGDSIQLSVNGDPNAPVYLYYQGTNGLQNQFIGSTNYNGSFSTTINRSTYNISPGASVYVVVNNQQSSAIAWPSGSYYGSQISLAQNSVSLNAGGNTSVTIYGSGNYYISSNSNSNIASANISGNTINIYGYSYGSTNINVCQTYGQCAVLSVSVNYSGYGNYPYNYPNNYPYNYQYGYQNNYLTLTPITFSQPNVYLSVGQSANISISGGSNGNYSGQNYYIGYNSNSNSVQTSLSNSTLALTGLANSATAIIICSASNNCGALNITVGQSGLYSTYGAYGQSWAYCSGENQYCSFSGTKSIRYGANGKYFYQTYTNGVMCSNYVFGDPVFGSVKQCSFNN